MSLTKVNRIRQCALWSAASFAAVGLVGSGLMWAVPAENSVGNSAQRATREIQDAGVGIVWLLVKDNQHPGARALGCGRCRTGGDWAAARRWQLGRSLRAYPAATAPRPAGRRSHSDRRRLADGAPAAGRGCVGAGVRGPVVGGAPRSRGKTVRVVALGPGRARLAQNPGAKP